MRTGYTGYLLSEASRQDLLGDFPPYYERLVGHHITEQFGTAADAPAPPSPDIVQVVGYFNKDGVEGLVVEIDGVVERGDGSLYHITWSLAADRKPVDSNKHVRGFTPLEVPILIDVFAKNFFNS